MLNSKLAYKIQKRDNFICQYCGKDGLVTLENWHNTVVDHFDLSGGNEEKNLVTACHYCNAIKGDKKFGTLEEAKKYIRKRRIELEKNYFKVCKDMGREYKEKRIFVSAKTPEDWKSLLAKPEKHWETGYSAKALACCWQEADGFPESVIVVFKNSGIELFKNIELLLAFPEYKVPLPGGLRPSQNDIFILARSDNQLISITVEGKVSEGFGNTVAEWMVKNESAGKQERLVFLLDKLQLPNNKIDNIRYQLIHRTASAIIEAEKFNAKSALMLIHSFSRFNEGFDDYGNFLALFNLKGEIDSLVLAKKLNGIDLYFSWVKGEEKYLTIH